MIKQQPPLVSIVIPSYNHSQFIQEAIQSVVDQDYGNIELIVIDDGSKDDSVEKIKQMISVCEKRFVRFEFRSRENQGLSKTLNEGLAWVSSSYVCFIASDDVCLSYRVSNQIEFMEKNRNISLCSAGVEVINAEGGLLYRKESEEIKYFDFKSVAFFSYSMPAPTLMFKVNSLRSIGGFDESILVEDFYILLKYTFSNYCIANIGKVLVRYRRHASNSSSVLFREHAFDRQRSILKFSQSEYCIRSLSFSNIIYATQLLAFSKKESFQVFYNAIYISPVNFFSKRSFRWFLFLFLNKNTIKKILSL